MILWTVQGPNEKCYLSGRIKHGSFLLQLGNLVPYIR